MKNSLLILFILLIASHEINAQPGKPTRERIESMKIGFLTERLNLNPEEAKVFWPVYNQFQNELNDVRKNRKENMRDAAENFDDMSDSDAEKFVDEELVFRQKELDIQKKYHPQLKKVLPAKKVARLYRAEEDFKRKLLEMIRERRDGMQQGPPMRKKP
ncbi:MAG: hypothetical protein DWQ44_03400 [Bacteroidetes bacterium]|nr:MAG: hypothetical protein DWQ33_04405 [Bacteroidota bacterium]REJ99959.1 MAG: hypothetical protein DWQ39_13675 [Bacteroidota bacterium]REK35861.1 MAG: hypothetical protein DWQ44_03400 [Bacteroidota bacterium]REK50662.1 MAG: hypothetical protein DWQ48_04965 [Bacteroidota bacterium]